MKNISRDTFNKLKHYVGVRIQQGVPLVDADWNEMDDIRKYELQAFLKWFVGSGVPTGNDGFRILSVYRKVVLRSNRTARGESSLIVDVDQSTAAAALGFEPGNSRARRMALPAAQLASSKSGPFVLADGMTLAVSADGMATETVMFRPGQFADIGQATAAEVSAAINGAMTRLSASAGGANDFLIQGGNGTPEGAGRCVVEGWDVINESDMTYTAQPLFDAATAAAWGVATLTAPTTPQGGTTRVDTVYLDVWEREVFSQEDGDLLNSVIGLETCYRLKREWVVRVEEGKQPAELPAPSAGHVYYPLAILNRTGGADAIQDANISDLRRTGLAMPALSDVQQMGNDIRQVAKDAYGEDYTLDHDGQQNLEISLREAVNAMLRDEPALMAPVQLKTAAIFTNLVSDSDGNVWVFYIVQNANNYELHYQRYIQSSRSWENEGLVTTSVDFDFNLTSTPFALGGRNGDIWVFWTTSRSGESRIWYNRFSSNAESWETPDGAEIPITPNLPPPPVGTVLQRIHPFALEDSAGDIWVFLLTNRSGTFKVRSHRYSGGSWTTPGTGAVSINPPEINEESKLYAIEHMYAGVHRRINVFWACKPYNDASNIMHGASLWTNYFDIATNQWAVDFSTDSGMYGSSIQDVRNPSVAIIESNQMMIIVEGSYAADNSSMLFWSYYNYGSIYPYTFNNQASLKDEFAFIANIQGSSNKWIFWHRVRDNYVDVWCKPYKSAANIYSEKEHILTTRPGYNGIPAAAESTNMLWVFWIKVLSLDPSTGEPTHNISEYEVWFRKIALAL